MGGLGPEGFEQPREKVTWTKRDLLLFANSIGCTVDELHFLYELHPKFTAFPTYPVILPFKKANIEVTDFYKQSSPPGDIPGVPKLDYRRVVDGERKIQFLKPLPATSEGRNFELRTRLVGAYDKGKATVLQTEHLIVDKDTEEVYTRTIGSGFFVGQGGWGGPKGPETKSHPPPKGQSGIKVQTKLTQEAAHLYRLNGDYNPLHATPEPGKAMGFGGPIMHGLCSWNMAAHILLKTLGDSDPTNFKEFQARFASPVKPGSTLETEMWRMGDVDKDGFEEVRFTMKSDGKLCLSNGRARVRCVEKGGKSKL